MIDLGSHHVTVQDLVDDDIAMKIWEHGDPFPQLDTEVGVDTETELITDTVLDPPIVVLGLFSFSTRTCWYVSWQNVAEFMTELNRRNIRQYYFNLGFDELECDNEDPEKTLLEAIEQGRVRDMQIRIHLRDIATIGFILGRHYSLEQCSQHLLHLTLDKGEKDDPNSHRLTFRRDKPVTMEQYIYLMYDCVSTWGLGRKVPEQPTEVQHTKGMVVLAHLSRNGDPVDMRIFDAFEKKLIEQRDEYRMKLLDFGFPDPYKNTMGMSETEWWKRQLREKLTLFIKTVMPAKAHEYLVPNENWGDEARLNNSKANIRMALVYMYNWDLEPQFTCDLEDSVVYWLCNEKPKNLRKKEEPLYNSLVEEYHLLGVFDSKKEIVLNAFMATVLEDLLMQQDTKAERGYDIRHAVECAGELLDANPHWTNAEEKVGPQVFLQDHIERLIQTNKGLELEKTEKSGKYKLTLKDMWRLEDAGVNDPFIDVYTKYKHADKYLSTYLNREFIRADGKIHARFTNILKTGRTSCTKPNLQNLPSRDKQYPLKNMFCPPKGAILCATDFSFIELCAFAQTCYSRFGHSVMRDVINAGLDPHRWFAGVMNKIITADLTHKDDPEWVKKTKAFLKEKVPDNLRQYAKAANFGFPGALGVDTFYKNCRETGIKLTYDEAKEMRDAWLNTFTEMQDHMRPLKASKTAIVMREFGLRKHDDDEEEDDDIGGEYKAVLPCGQVRNHCSYNAACNTQFQGTTAVGAKLAGWNLVYNGYGDRLLNFVHDEYLYWLLPLELRQHIPIIERLMIDGMKQVIPDVKVGVESSCMLHWDKKATVFADLQWDDNGLPILTEPPFVQSVLQSA